MPSPPPRPRSPAGDARAASIAAECFDQLARLIDRDTDDLAKLMARECGKTLTECRAEVIEGLHMVQYVFGTGRMPIGDDRRIGDRGEGRLRSPQAVGRGRGHHAVELPVRRAALDARAVACSKATRPSSSRRKTRRRSASGSSSCSSRPASRRGRSTSFTATARVGEALVRNPDVNVVLFTGSYEVGRRIQQISADFHDRIVAAEMGSKSAVIVCEDAKLDLAVNAAIISAFKTSGQRCVSAGRILVAEKIFDALREAATSPAAKRLRIGDPLDADSFTGPVINEAAVEKVLQLQRSWPSEEGAQVLVEGGRLTRREPQARLASCRRSSIAWSTARRCAASARKSSARTWR